MSSSYPRDIPPMWLLLTTAAMVTLHFTMPLQMLVVAPWRNLGWIVIAGGILLVVLSAFQFKRAGTGVRPFSEATMVVSGGAFRWSRNPMYLGMVTVTVGVAIWLGSASPMWLPVMLFVVLDRRFVRREEDFLRNSQGTTYDDYCTRVRRWL